MNVLRAVWRSEWRIAWKRIPGTGRRVACAACPRHGLRVDLRWADGWADYVISDPHGEDSLLSCAPTLDEIHAKLATICADMERSEAAP